MCFRIDHGAKRPKRRKAYKIVHITRGGLVVSHIHNKHWQCNKTHSIRKNACIHMQGSAHEGIYVYCSLAAAKDTFRYGNISDSVIMKVEVDPADWLYSSYDNGWCSGVATYRKVYVPEEQPYMEWYDG